MRAGDFAAVDGVADVHVGVHRAFGLEVAQCCEAVFQRDARVAGAEDRAVGDGLVEQLHVVGLGGRVALQQQVRVDVDEARQHRQLRQIDDLGVGAGLALDLRERPNGFDAVALDEDADVGLRLVGAAVDQAAGFDQNLCGLSR